MTRIIIGLIAAGAVAVVGHRARALTVTGAVAATMVGAASVTAGWNWAAILILYFGLSALLSRIGSRRKRARLGGMVEKTGARDAAQVIANGFPFLACALLWSARRGEQISIWQTCGIASLAASAADTWATEIGTFVGQTPRSILTWRTMPVGESGGVTAAGWLASLVGASFVGGVATIAMPTEGLSGLALITLGGMAGSFVDSLVGASLQRRSWCDVCNQPTEMRTHTCGTRTRHIGGLTWLENDGVNLIATTTGALVPLFVKVALPGLTGHVVW
jgi:uncharacterized protein (TIGR00297 family)